MIELLDGPAAGQTLNLRRAPVMLRIVESKGKWDGLDQPDDEPRRGETVHVYIQVGTTMQGHIRSSKPGVGGFFVHAKYRYFPDQPSVEHVREKSAWAAWCDENKPVLLEMKKALEANL